MEEGGKRERKKSEKTKKISEASKCERRSKSLLFLSGKTQVIPFRFFVSFFSRENLREFYLEMSSLIHRVVRQRNRDQAVIDLIESDHVELPSAAHTPVASLMLSSQRTESPEPTQIQIPHNIGIVSLCSVPKFSRLFVGLQDGRIAYYSTKKWRLRGTISCHKGRIYSIVLVPPCWLWSACDGGQVSVCKISRNTVTLEHTMTVHGGKMVKSLLWSPSSQSTRCSEILFIFLRARLTNNLLTLFPPFSFNFCSLC